jgi:N-acetylglucosaminyldiphosphoundecaprenol N-acetyl-beta-D-mannosaminyltransferase
MTVFGTNFAGADRAAGALTLHDDGISIFRVLGTPVSIVSMDRILKLFEHEWIPHRRDRYIVLRDVHGVMRARSDAKLRKAHEASDLTAPDGMPLVWIAKLAGINGITRVAGSDLLSAVCERGVALGWRHYFLGGAPGIAERAIQQLTEKHPGISIVGLSCPPFKPLSVEEDEIICATIRSARPDFVWVGLGTPKQEIWMHEHRGQCGGATLLGVGAAFDFHAGVISRAPKWMQRYGLEWLHRLMQEPKRLWTRYLVLAPMFSFLALSDLLRRRIAIEPGRTR